MCLAADNKRATAAPANYDDKDGGDGGGGGGEGEDRGEGETEDGGGSDADADADLDNDPLLFKNPNHAQWAKQPSAGAGSDDEDDEDGEDGEDGENDDDDIPFPVARASTSKPPTVQQTSAAYDIKGMPPKKPAAK